MLFAKAGKPIVRLVPIEEPLQDRILGQDEGLFTVPEDFNNPFLKGDNQYNSYMTRFVATSRNSLKISLKLT